MTNENNFSGTTGMVKDIRDNSEYKWKQIESQIWMIENLRFKTDTGCWAYDNNNENLNKYGYLYNWEGAKAVAENFKGWRLPTNEDCSKLIYSCNNSIELVFELLNIGKYSDIYLKDNNNYTLGACSDFWIDNGNGNHTQTYFNGLANRCNDLLKETSALFGYNVRLIKNI